MRTYLLTLLVVVFLTSCAESQIRESKWIDAENENTLLSIRKDNDTYWLHFFYQPLKIVTEASIPYVTLKYPGEDVELPLLFKDNENLSFYGKNYIPLEKSMKGRFIGEWKSPDESTRFVVQMDSNIELNWDIIKDSGKPVRFYPKRTENGVHFTLGRDTLYFEIRDGFVVDKNGAKYSKVKG